MPTTSATITEPRRQLGIGSGDEQQALVASRLGASRLAEAVEVAAVRHEAELDPGALQLGEHHVRVVVGEEGPRQVDFDVVVDDAGVDGRGQLGAQRPADTSRLDLVDGDRGDRVARPRRRRPAAASGDDREQRSPLPRRPDAQTSWRPSAASTTPATEGDRHEGGQRPRPVVVLRHEPERRHRDSRRGDEPGDDGDDAGDARRRDGRRPHARRPSTATPPATISHTTTALTAPGRLIPSSGSRNVRIDAGSQNGGDQGGTGDDLDADLEAGARAIASRPEHVAEIARYRRTGRSAAGSSTGRRAPATRRAVRLPSDPASARVVSDEPDKTGERTRVRPGSRT